MTLTHSLRALAAPNYRRFFAGQCVSLLGNWMTSTAAFWLVYHLSGNPAHLGLVVFANQIPVPLLAPFAGVWVDRTDRVRVLKVTQILSLLQSAALAVLVLSGHATVARIIGLCFVQGFINGVDWPARQSLSALMVGERSHLDNAIALNSLTFNAARLVGPAIAGFVIAAWGPGVCFAIDAASFVAVLAALFALRLPAHVPRAAAAHPLTDLREGLGYAWRHPALRTLLLLVPGMSLFGFAHVFLAPVFARDIFHGDARMLGFLLSVTGVGSVLAGVYLALRPTTVGLERTIALGSVLTGAGLAGFAFAPALPLACAALVAVGAGGVLAMAGTNTLLQSLVHDDKRGRVMGLFVMGQGMYPVGSLAVGAIAAATGAPWATFGCGLVCLAIAFWFSRRGAAFATPGN